jgi:hypothetical protein
LTLIRRYGNGKLPVSAAADLEEKLDLELSPETFYDHPTVDNLSNYLAGKHAARAG